MNFFKNIYPLSEYYDQLLSFDFDLMKSIILQHSFCLDGSVLKSRLLVMNYHIDHTLIAGQLHVAMEKRLKLVRMQIYLVYCDQDITHFQDFFALF